MTKKLPKSLEMNHILGLRIPGDLTLAEAREFSLTTPVMKELARISKRANGDTARIEITFSIEGKPAPEGMTVSEWRRRRGVIGISDGSGGLGAKTPEPV